MSKARKFGEVRSADGEVVAQLFCPAKSSDALSVALEVLTQQLDAKGCAEKSSGGFGGTYGYGAAFENDVFLMHPYCWCEKEDCLWCGWCGCVKGECRYFIDDEEVSSNESWRRNQAFLGPLPHEKHKDGTRAYAKYSREWDARVEERNRRWRTLYPAVIHTCDRREMFLDRSEGDTWKPSTATQAPHFWHKASGLRVRWYKYIGRDMEVESVPESLTVTALLEECLLSIGCSLEQAVGEFEAALVKDRENFQKQMEWMNSPEGEQAMQRLMDSGAIRTFSFGGNDESDDE